MGTMRIHEEFSQGWYWHQILKPTLDELHVELVHFLLVSALHPYNSYVGFIKIKHLSEDETTYGPWFSDYIQINAKFAEDLRLAFKPVHFTKEIRDFQKGKILMDNRQNM